VEKKAFPLAQEVFVMRSRGLTLAETLVASSIALLLVGIATTAYVSSQRQARAVQERSHKDFLMAKLLKDMERDLNLSDAAGCRFREPDRLFIRRRGWASSEGSRWGELVGYRLSDNQLRRHQGTLAALPADQPFPENLDSLESLWNTKPVHTAQDVKAVSVRFQAHAIGVEVEVNYRPARFPLWVSFQI